MVRTWDGNWVACVTKHKDERRAFYFAAQEVMILPTFNKTRALRGAKAEFLTRHADPETSYLLKAFLLLVHPVLVVFE